MIGLFTVRPFFCRGLDYIRGLCDPRLHQG
jgi:hypothetical protein